VKFNERLVEFLPKIGNSPLVRGFVTNRYKMPQNIIICNKAKPDKIEVYGEFFIFRNRDTLLGGSFCYKF
jgi:hypothetical protein